MYGMKRTLYRVMRLRIQYLLKQDIVTGSSLWKKTKKKHNNFHKNS